MKDSTIGLLMVGIICGSLAISSIFRPGCDPEVKSLRDDLNQLILVVADLDEPVIVVDGQVADETFDWNEFHNVKVAK